jgi:hypothetical protein
VCFSDGTEAIAGVKAEVEKSQWRPGSTEQSLQVDEADGDEEVGQAGTQGAGENSWISMSIEVPGFRDDDALPVFLSAMLTEALLADGKLKDRLWINRRFHWKLYIDVRTMCARPRLVKLTGSDTAPVRSSFLSAPPPFPYHTSCTPLCSFAET